MKIRLKNILVTFFLTQLYCFTGCMDDVIVSRETTVFSFQSCMSREDSLFSCKSREHSFAEDEIDNSVARVSNFSDGCMMIESNACMKAATAQIVSCRSVHKEIVCPGCQSPDNCIACVIKSQVGHWPAMSPTPSGSPFAQFSPSEQQPFDSERQSPLDDQSIARFCAALGARK